MLKIFVIEDDTCIREPFCSETSPCCDALITDNLMPKMTGLEFITNQIRKGCKLPAENRLLISGNLMDRDIKRAEELGVAYVQKPVTFDFLEKWIKTIETVPRVSKSHPS